MTKKNTVALEEPVKIRGERVRYYIVGTTPMIIRRMSQKYGLRDLLFPKGRKTAAEKAHSLKHDPIAEFRDAPYTIPDSDAPTLLAQLSTCFKRAMASAALDIPGATKAQMGRLCWVHGEKVAIYGYPKLFMSVTRSADINRTPDVRTRCIIPRWAAMIDVSYVVPILREPHVSTLLAAAGITQGIGDWRPQKGSGNYGQFKLVEAKDKEFKEIVESGGRDVQIEGMQRALPYDEETGEMLAWFLEEAERRGIKEVTR